ncbi:hypothetical protein DF3PB_780014 [uncultured Defluviicoccus sp.]|uniref:Uncharacterized protein n=1 Tax=metagenome TaxID=256318 RepID=A0A380TKS1_9ZZZZ|nr:hypothetical protein DF3PB_780014 [uncultured Defluviicoccus sp.]
MPSAAGFASFDFFPSIPNPVKRIRAAFGAPPERGVWPVCRRRNGAVLDRVEVNVIQVRRVVPNGALPKAASPAAAFAVGTTHGGRALSLMKSSPLDTVQPHL